MAEESLNLTVPRSEKTVWDKPSFSSRLATYDQDRWMALACGAALTTLGTRRGGILGGLLAAAGTTLSVRAMIGRRDLHVARVWLDRRLRDRGWRSQDIVMNASEESFPASDSPAWTPTI